MYFWNTTRGGPYNFLDYIAVGVGELHRSRSIGLVRVEREVKVFPIKRETPGGHVIRSRFQRCNRRKVCFLGVARFSRLAGQYRGEIYA